jgi:hypothetical protein
LFGGVVCGIEALPVLWISEALVLSSGRRATLSTEASERLLELAEFCAKGEFEFIFAGEPTEAVDTEPKLTEDGTGFEALFDFDEFGGLDDKEIRGYVVTKHELLVVAKYWLRRMLDDSFHRYYFASGSRAEYLTRMLACRRLSRIEVLLGKEEITRAGQEVESEFAKEIGPRLLKMFENNEELPRDHEGYSDCS